MPVGKSVLHTVATPPNGIAKLNQKKHWRGGGTEKVHERKMVQNNYKGDEDQHEEG